MQGFVRLGYRTADGVICTGGSSAQVAFVFMLVSCLAHHMANLQVRNISDDLYDRLRPPCP